MLVVVALTIWDVASGWASWLYENRFKCD